MQALPPTSHTTSASCKPYLLPAVPLRSHTTHTSCKKYLLQVVPPTNHISCTLYLCTPCKLYLPQATPLTSSTSYNLYLDKPYLTQAVPHLKQSVSRTNHTSHKSCLLQVAATSAKRMYMCKKPLFCP